MHDLTARLDRADHLGEWRSMKLLSEEQVDAVTLGMLEAEDFLCALPVRIDETPDGLTLRILGAGAREEAKTSTDFCRSMCRIFSALDHLSDLMVPEEQIFLHPDWLSLSADACRLAVFPILTTTQSCVQIPALTLAQRVAQFAERGLMRIEPGSAQEAQHILGMVRSLQRCSQPASCAALRAVFESSAALLGKGGASESKRDAIGTVAGDQPEHPKRVSGMNSSADAPALLTGCESARRKTDDPFVQGVRSADDKPSLWYLLQHFSRENLARYRESRRGSSETATLSYGDEAYPLAQLRFAIGKRSDCDLVIDNTAISRRHGEIICEAGRYFYEDCGSTNGSRINGQALMAHKRYPLTDGDEIMLAREQMHFHLGKR